MCINPTCSSLIARLDFLSLLPQHILQTLVPTSKEQHVRCVDGGPPGMFGEGF